MVHAYRLVCAFFFLFIKTSTLPLPPSLQDSCENFCSWYQTVSQATTARRERKEKIQICCVDQSTLAFIRRRDRASRVLSPVWPGPGHPMRRSLEECRISVTKNVPQGPAGTCRSNPTSQLQLSGQARVERGVGDDGNTTSIFIMTKPRDGAPAVIDALTLLSLAFSLRVRRTQYSYARTSTSPS